MTKKVKRTGRLGAVAIALVVGLTGCGATTPKANGADIANAKEFLEAAEATFKKDVAQLGPEVVTVAGDAKCFFEEGSGKGEVTGMVYCGPVKRYGKTGSWAGMSFQGSNTPKGVVLSEATFKEQADPKGKLFRPDNASPGDPEKLAAPLGPRTDQKEFAVLIPLDSASSIKFTDLENPAVLKQPAGSLTVNAKAELDGIPGRALQILGQHGAPSGGDDMLRPAEGQNFGAWRVDLANPEDIAPGSQEADQEREVQKPKDATATFTVEAGQTRLDIRTEPSGLTPGSSTSDNAVATLACRSVKCGDVKSGQYLLVVSTASLDGAQLVATTDEQVEKAPLTGGATQADHSLVLYQGGKTKVDVSTSFAAKTFDAVPSVKMTGAVAPAPIRLTYEARLTAAYRTPFESTLGWAPTGQAWLVISVEDLKFVSPDLASTKMDWAGSWAVTAGGSPLEMVDTGYIDRVVVKIPQDATDFQVTYQPKGNVQYSDEGGRQTKDVTAPEAQTADIKFS
jgi:lipoprotein